MIRMRLTEALLHFCGFRSYPRLIFFGFREYDNVTQTLLSVEFWQTRSECASRRRYYTFADSDLIRDIRAIRG